MTRARGALSFVLAVAALALAAVSAYAAREAGRAEAEIRRSDAVFRVEPAREDLWEAPRRIPRLADMIGTSDDVEFRRASRLFELLRRGGFAPFDAASRSLGADTELALASAQRVGLSREARSKAANLEGVLVLDQAFGDPNNGPELIKRSLDHFRRAIRTDPANHEAQYNLELLLRLLAPENARRAARFGVNATARGVAGAAPLRRGHGY